MSDRGKSHSNHVPSRLMRESLVDKDLIAATQSPVVRILPNINVIQIGGKIMDRGPEALLPLLDEIVENQVEHTQVIAVGAGVRSRHLFAVGIDLGLPTGVLATLSAKDAAQNAYMVSCLLAKHGFVLSIWRRHSSFNCSLPCLPPPAGRYSTACLLTTCGNIPRRSDAFLPTGPTAGRTWSPRCSALAA